MADEKKEPGYVIQYMKQTSMLGESISVSTSLPKEATQDQLELEFIKIGNALDGRMRAFNKQVLDNTGKSLADMNLEPGTIFVKPEEE